MKTIFRLGAVISLCAVTGCGVINSAEDVITPSPRLTYTPYNPAKNVKNGALAFTLEASAITFSGPQSADKSSGANPAAVPPPGGVASSASQSACPSDAKSTDWTPCLGQVIASSAVVAPDQKIYDPTKYFSTIFVATPESGWESFTTSYALSGMPVANNELLQKQIAVTSKDNLDNVIKGAGAGAVSGLAFGPYGAIAGALLGAFSGVAYQAAGLGFPDAPGTAPPPSWISALVCQEDTGKFPTYDYSLLSDSSPKPAMYLPFIVTPEPSWTPVQQGGKGPGTLNYMESDVRDAMRADPANCWTPVPNGHRPKIVGETGTSSPIEGDGWFYRIQDDKDLSDPETGEPSKPVANPTSSKGVTISSDPTKFPISACRKITIEITWWKALANFENNGPAILAVDFDTEIADPGFINYLTIPKSGSINFRLVCGAYVSNSFAGPPLGLLMTDATTQVNAIEKAMPTAKTTPAPQNPKNKIKP